MSSLGFWKALEDFPPVMVRICARTSIGGKNLRAMSSQEIAITSGIPLARLEQISEMGSWDEITMGETRKFVSACNFDPTNPAHIKRQRDYLRSCQTNPNRPPFSYLRRSPWWKSQFQPLIHLMRSGLLNSTATPSPASGPTTLLKSWRASDV